MTEIYKIFASDWKDHLDFTEDSLLELYDSECTGSKVSSNNGYAVGKKWLSVHVQMWKEDISKGLLFKIELYQDPKFPHWWLDSIFNKLS